MKGRAMTLTAHFPLLGHFWHAVTSAFEHPRDTTTDPRDDRAFLDEMISRCPDAFSNEQDLQYLMWTYPGRF
jgi:hypothetical protein